MPLPKIATPTHELELPSTGQKIKYRPFLVKEEKLLLLAMATEDSKELTLALKTAIENCIETPGIKVEKLPTFDLEYIFLNIRTRSVGNEIELSLICPDDGVTTVPVTLDIDKIKVKKNKNHKTDFKIGDDIMVKLKYPSLDEFSNYNIGDEEKTVEQSFEMIADCIDKIFTEEEVWSHEDLSREELVEWVEQMNSEQFKMIESFFDTMPKLSHTVKITNPKTKVKSDVVIEGLSSFLG